MATYEINNLESFLLASGLAGLSTTIVNQNVDIDMWWSNPANVDDWDDEIAYSYGAIVKSAGSVWGCFKVDGSEGVEPSIEVGNDWTFMRALAIGWQPMGTSAVRWAATWNGNNHKISNLYINATTDGSSFFGYTSGATIKDLGIVSCDITSTASLVGGVAGYNTASSTVINSYSTGSISGASFVGGVAGYNTASSTVTNSYSTGSISGASFVGGVVGYNTVSSTITNSYSTGSISGTDYVGGIVGYNTASSTITNSYSTGSISGATGVGGVVGYNTTSSTVTTSHAIGLITCAGTKGGVVGSNAGDPVATVVNSYYNSETTSVSFTAGRGVPLNAGQFASQINFTNFDFDEKWYIDDGMPKLRTFRTEPDLRSRWMNGMRQRWDGDNCR